ncbi:hypothetical protein NX059_010148 [Plenodomus lindquistii]|nr:hypothetical protein NX059_010148 [Plenodomus lindquistii]
MDRSSSSQQQTRDRRHNENDDHDHDHNHDHSDWPTENRPHHLTVPANSPRRRNRAHSDLTRDRPSNDQRGLHRYFTPLQQEEQPSRLAVPAAPSGSSAIRGAFNAREPRFGRDESAAASSSSGGPHRGSHVIHESDLASGSLFADPSEATRRSYGLAFLGLASASSSSGPGGHASSDGRPPASSLYPSYDISGPIDDLFDSPYISNSDSRNMRSLARSKRIRDKADKTEEHLTRTLASKGAVAVLSYNSIAPDPNANDIWPECRSAAKLPAQYSMLQRDDASPSQRGPQRQASDALGADGTAALSPHNNNRDPSDIAGRPMWKLPVELVEIIADHLNRDDIQALRLVSRELNYFVSQVIFKTVVVPFNTEIYGMLGPEPKPDFKGKKRARIDNPGYSWKNASGDEVYNGHGLDVFRGFGKHIRRYGMSFEVNEETLAAPPEKTMTESKTTFWGRYDWPFEEYRRFDAVAGLETAADETPRMKTAFSELTNVRELALSVDSGLGWLNGPDRSIRARVLRRPPTVFGTGKAVPDRRSRAQYGLWDALTACHEGANSDIRLATLYRLEGPRVWSEMKDFGILAEHQPSLPYMETRLIHEAVPHDTAEGNVSTSCEEPGDLDHLVLSPSTNKTGVLFTANFTPTDGGQAMSPVIPVNLTKAQKEWLLESEWAQRAFLSSYMLSIIDNSATFAAVHTLTISRLSDRHLSALDRSDFWEALPNLANATLIVLPSWRTVHKDEAGFVETPGVNPTLCVDRFHNLLRTRVATRPQIRNLTIGWATGGEHEEGLHGRNKLLFPSPLMQLGIPSHGDAAFTSDLLVATDAQRLGSAILHLPMVERLTMKNCWITPPVLLQFIKTHDLYSLKHLVLDSVSLTAMLRPQANANQAAPGGALANAPNFNNNALWNALQNQANGVGPAALQVPAHLLANQNQFVQIYLQTLQLQLQQLQANAVGGQHQHQITALQQQVQQLQPQVNVGAVPLATQQTIPGVWAQNAALPQPQALPVANLFNNNAALLNLALQVQVMQQQVNVAPAPPAVAVAPPTNAQQTTAARSILKLQQRPGSWIDVIDQVSPGTNLADFGSEHSHADPQRLTSLQDIEFISCGNARLPYATLEQNGIGNDNAIAAITQRTPTFQKRHVALEPVMLSAKWAHLGEIVQCTDQDELAALDAGWNLRTGWEDKEAATAAEFDGLLPSGTGRFTGTIRRSDRVTDSTSASGESLCKVLSALSLRD